jgi:uncharacterized damage-inducible protein DinB
MNPKHIYLITDVSGLTPQIGRLVSMMSYARHTTLDEVSDLTVQQLDYLHDRESNSIGALLKHIAAVEVVYQTATFENRRLSASEDREWGAALKLGPRARREIRGHNLDYYLTALENVRAHTLAEFAKRDDDWLYEETPFWDGLPANNYFKWFHVFEDEINHRGQIRWLRKRLPETL